MNVIIKECWNENDLSHAKGLVDGMEFYVNGIYNTDNIKPNELTPEQIQEIVTTIYDLKTLEISSKIQ